MAKLAITPVGQILRERTLISEEALQQALAEQQRSHDRLGRILLTQGHISAFALHSALAEHYGLEFVNLSHTPADALLQNADHIPDYIRLQAIPYAMHKETTLIATAEPSEELSAWAQRLYGDAHRFVITSPYDIYQHIDRHFAAQLDDHSRHCLWQMMPQKSARRVLSPSQKRDLLVFMALLAGLAFFFPHQLLLWFMLLINVFYFCTLLLKAQLFTLGSRYRPGSLIPPQALAALRDDHLPVYTLLIPLHDEAETLPRLLRALDALDYPKAKLDIKLIVERDDERTIQAIKTLAPHRGYELIYVPYSLPQTKPKACNYALHFARGKYVTIYDAEDMPDPLQLKKAVHWFSKQPEHVVCLQARLNYYNREHSVLTRLFAIEYAAWFDFMLPGLRHLDIPIPLGGTSNHIDLQKLRELGEWDPYNVTEDADLGIRLALQRYTTDMLDSLTAEEAPIHLKVWMSQRTRWIRGYMQTWLVHMRHPLQLMRQLDATAFWGFQFFIGGPCLVFLSAPLLWIISICWGLGFFAPDAPQLSPLITSFALGNLCFGLLSHLLYAIIIIRRYQWQGMGKALLAFPLYWLLHSWASFRALWQLIVNPHIWEKTPHGHAAETAEDSADTLRHMQ